MVPSVTLEVTMIINNCSIKCYMCGFCIGNMFGNYDISHEKFKKFSLNAYKARQVHNTMIIKILNIESVISVSQVLSKTDEMNDISF